MEHKMCKHDPKAADTSEVRVLFVEIIFVALFVGVVANQDVVVTKSVTFF